MFSLWYSDAAAIPWTAVCYSLPTLWVSNAWQTQRKLVSDYDTFKWRYRYCDYRQSDYVALVVAMSLSAFGESKAPLLEYKLF